MTIERWLRRNARHDVPEEIHLDEQAAVRVIIHRPTDRQTGVARVRVVLIVFLALLVAVSLTGWGYSTWRYSQTPPPMSTAATSAGAIRLTHPNPRLPGLPTDVDVASGGRAFLLLWDVSTDSGGVVAAITVTPPAGDETLVNLQLNEPVQVGNVTVRLVAAYDMPGAAHDAADVVLTATG